MFDIDGEDFVVFLIAGQEAFQVFEAFFGVEFEVFFESFRGVFEVESEIHGKWGRMIRTIMTIRMIMKTGNRKQKNRK